MCIVSLWWYKEDALLMVACPAFRKRVLPCLDQCRVYNMLPINNQ